jgi:hypothetical protein
MTEQTTDYFNQYYSKNVAYKAAEVDAVIGYFLKRNFEKSAAINTAVILLEQAALSNIPAFKIIDTLVGLNDVQLSNLVAQILNFNRENTSAIGYKLIKNENLFDKRNIIL